MPIDQSQYVHAMAEDTETGKPMQKVAASLTGINVKDKIYGSANITKNYDTPMRGFEIVNDGVANLTYTINGMTFDVKAGEVDYNPFDPFTSVTITATSAYRARVFG